MDAMGPIHEEDRRRRDRSHKDGTAMRLNRVMMVLGLLAFALAMSGCNNNKASLEEENALLMEEIQAVRGQLADRNAALESANREMREKDLTIAELNRELSSAERSQATSPPASMTGFEQIPGVTGSMSPGRVTATVEGDVLFDSGKTALKSNAKRSLDAIANVLNSTYAGRDVRVVGHTDTDPIRKSGFKTNYHLGFERAYAVREYLISRGVSADRLSLASFGPDKPMGSKAKSRRVEIVVLLQ
jgi:outer membrane protein OmpA-like peptidoglycan-associated protein